MLRKINNIKQMLETLKDDTMTNCINIREVRKISQQLEEIIKESNYMQIVDK